MANGWGGRRPGAGRKKKALTDRISEGKSASVVSYEVTQSLKDVTPLPDVLDFMKRDQMDKIPFHAERVFRETWKYLSAAGVAEIVGIQQVQAFAQMVARWIQCEEAVSKMGIVARRASGSLVVSPYVTAGNDYLKMANNIWSGIVQVMKENSSTDWKTNKPEDAILRSFLGLNK